MMGILSLLFILMMLTPALGAISLEDAWITAGGYSIGDGEQMDMNLYTLESHPYYFVEYSVNNTLTGVLVIDGETGEVVKDSETVQKISYTNFYLKNVTQEYISGLNISAQVYKASSDFCNKQADLFKKEIPTLKDGDRQKLGTIAQSYQEAGTAYGEMATLYGEVAVVASDVVSGNRSYENAMKLTGQMDELEKILIKLGTAYDHVIADMNIYFDILIENPEAYRVNKTQMEDYKVLFNTNWPQEKELIVNALLQSIEDDRENTKNRTEVDVQLMDVRVKTAEMPGFTFFLTAAVLGLAAIVAGKKYRK
ncbi:hypothetical protein MsAc7_11140 [Methanolapillus millepedarum]|uniref:Uncharacterized protein n=2 Tax=Methanolapillus millepedarum TaxID=3028296 RepID=A0AA96VFC1_9EURY|nr:hypothetical protein MsAc7_11140 [Methanosarcinaceae archaeon Ac7]